MADTDTQPEIESTAERIARHKEENTAKTLPGLAVGRIVHFTSLFNPFGGVAVGQAMAALVTDIDAKTGRPHLSVFPPHRSPVAMPSVPHKTELGDRPTASGYWTFPPKKPA